MDNDYIKKNFNNLFGFNLVYTIYFLLENNREQLLNFVEKIKPQIIINDIYKNIETVENYRLAVFLNSALDISDLKKLSNLKIDYNTLVDNWTTLDEIKSILISKNFIDNNTKREEETKKEGSLLNALIGFITSGEKSTTTTQKPQQKKDNTLIIIIAVIIMFIIFSLIMFKNKILK